MQRDIHLERLTERLRELRELHPDNATFYVEAAKVLLSSARNSRERREAEIILKDMRTAKRVGLFET
jgi:hypothetical protein